MPSLPPLREVITRHGLAARKSLGQHFLFDLNLTDKIVKAAGLCPDVTVFEIGPGPGGLTRSLMKSAAKEVIVIEKDPRCLPALEELRMAFPEKKLSILCGDALTLDITSLAPPPRAVVANLPYNVGTAMLIQWLHQIDELRSLTLMLQAEVIDRLVAVPESKAYGRLSVLTQFCCDAKRVLKVPASAFTPPPKVESAVVHLCPRKDRPQDVQLAILEKITEKAFGQRRKMLRTSLKGLGGEALLNKASINACLRAEDLSLQDFEALARAYAAPD